MLANPGVRARALAVMCSASAVLGVGCGSDDAGGSGSLAVLVEAEDVITDGIEPGEGAENVRDGWTVRFDKYVLTIGDIALRAASDANATAVANELHVVDLVDVPPSGLELWSFDGLSSGRWDFEYATPAADASAVRHESVSEEDHAAIVENGWTYLVEGEISRSDGQSCPPAALASVGAATPNAELSGTNPCYDAPSVRFTFGAPADTRFGPCEVDGVPGVAIASGSTQTVAATIHGDHLFFNGFPEGDEGGVQRLAQWLADCDLDLDGSVTVEELSAISPDALPELDDRYQLGGSPVTPLATMYDYVIGQLMTQGHMNGEGECALGGAQ